MTRTNRPRPWHEVVRLKEELRSGELALAEFAADLYEVAQAQGRRPGLRGPGEVLRADLSHPRVARAGEGRGGAARRTERQGGAAARADLRRREDAHADHAPSSVPRPTRTAGSARRAGVPRARRHGSAGGVPGNALLRQDRCRARYRGSARPRRGKLAPCAIPGACWRSSSPARTGCARFTPTGWTGSGRRPPRSRCWPRCWRSPTGAGWRRWSWSTRS